METRTAVAVGFGGMLGATVRWGLTEAFEPARGDWPWAVFLANVAGCLALGALVGAFGHLLHTGALVGATTGFCGALTTFSAFAVDLAYFVEDHDWALLGGYLAASVIVGIASYVAGRAWAGLAAGRSGPR